MSSAAVLLLPDRLTDSFPVMLVENGRVRATRRTSLALIRTGEDGTAQAGTRRYEAGADPTDHPAAMLRRRVVIRDSGARPTIPAWSRSANGLHPDRHDIASWMTAARAEPDAHWVRHLGFAIRDAIRDVATDTALTVALPDRAYLALTDDDSADIRDTLLTGFSEPLHEIDELSHRTGRELAPIRLGTRDRHRRNGVVTRAEAVVAEAIANGHDTTPAPPPTPDTITGLWSRLVEADHAQRLRQTAPGVWSAPVAILDDHRDGSYRATLILATLRIALPPAQPDIWFDYHEAVEITASRILQMDLGARIAGVSDDARPERAAMLACLRDHALPVLELATTPEGTYTSRDLVANIPDAVPLLARPPAFDLPRAILALLHFRDTRTHAARTPFAWGDAAASPHGGEEDQDGAGTDTMVATQTATPPRTDHHAPGSDPDVGDPDQAHETDDQGSEEGQGGAEDGDIDFDSLDGTGTDATGGGDDGPMSGSGQARLDPPGLAAARALGAGLAGDAAASPHGGEEDQDGAGTDTMVATQTATPPRTDHHAPGSDPDVGDPDQAHETDDQGSEEGQGGDPLALLIAALRDDDIETVRRIRTAVASAKLKRSARPGVTAVPEDADLEHRAEFISRVLAHFETRLPRSSAKTQAALAPFLRLYRAKAAWPRLLLVLNILDLAKAQGVTSANRLTNDMLRQAATNTENQCATAKIALPGHPGDAPAPGRGGGAHG